MSDNAQTTITASNRADVYLFLGRLRQSQKRDLAERFGLDLTLDPRESTTERDKGWLLEAKALGRLDELLAAACEMEAANART